MAGDWIKFELATLDKPEVIAMAEVLGTSTFDVVGRVLKVWGWFDQRSKNGNAGSVTGNVLLRFIDQLVGSQGFAACMRNVGWLTDTGLPNFDRHNGETAKSRALTNKRVKRLRNDASVTEALPEKRREEITPISPAGFEGFWKSYPANRRVGKGKCRQFWIANRLEPAAAQIALHVAAMAATDQWTKEGGKYAPTTLTYLNQRRFDDGLPEAPARRLVI